MTISGYLKCRQCGSVFERNCTDPEVTFFMRWDKCCSCGKRQPVFEYPNVVGVAIITGHCQFCKTVVSGMAHMALSADHGFKFKSVVVAEFAFAACVMGVVAVGGVAMVNR